MVETQFDRKIKRLRIDWEGEFQSFSDLVRSSGIIFDHSCPHTSGHNGRAERKHRHIVEMGLTLLAQSAMPPNFFNNYSPETQVTLTIPHSWLNLPFVASESVAEASPQAPATSDQTSSSHFDAASHVSVMPHDISTTSVSSESVAAPSNTPDQPRASPIAPDSPLASQGPAVSTHPMITHGKSGIFKPRVFTGQSTFTFNFHEPLSVEEALQHEGWNAAMGDEISALKRNKTWILVPPSPSYNVV
uniref:Integrase catalytic domain-containing protein n=1 Tax=Cannabis sativa TaxID=3483 RepID=A0A803NFL3_CANSA